MAARRSPCRTAPRALVASAAPLGLMMTVSLLLALAPLEAGAEGAAAPAEQADAQAPAPPGPRELPFTKANVLAIVTLHADELQSCYEEAMAKRGSTAKDAPAGRVLMSWTITVDGLPADVKVMKSEIADGLVTDCMVNAIRFWEFPRPELPQPVEFPFELKAISGTKTMVGDRNKVDR